MLPAPIAEAEFERRFRMPRSVYEVLREGLLETDGYVLQKKDALGKLGASTDQKRWSAQCASWHTASRLMLFASTCVCLNQSPQSPCTGFVRRFESGSNRNGFEGLT
jgi:hypothetical protein